MSQAVPFVQTYLANVQRVVDALEEIRVAQVRVAGDPGLVAAYFASGQARTDITAADLTAANNAITAILATYDAGSPSNKSKLFFVT